MRQVDLAERTGLPRSYVSRVEAGRHQPGWGVVLRVAQALGMSVSELVSEAECILSDTSVG